MWRRTSSRSAISAVSRIKRWLTEKGERIAREIPVEPMEIFRSALAGLTATEARDLLRVLTKLARRVQSIVREGATKRETP